MGRMRTTCIGDRSVGLLSDEIGGGGIIGLSVCGLSRLLNDNDTVGGGVGSSVLPGTLSMCSKVDQSHWGRSLVFVAI
jgi:hypothetical protein